MRLLFVTGRLAEPALRGVVEALSREAGFDYEVAVLGISVAALMHVGWVKRKLSIPAGVDRVILPGWCQGDLRELEDEYGVPFELGPKDLFDLPEHLGRGKRTPADLQRYDIEILAEINHAPHLTDRQILDSAQSYRTAGADVIDLGCVPGESWSRAGEVTRLLRAYGFRVSIDSFDRTEVESAVEGGAELVLSCNSSNVEWARLLEAELVVLPDDPHDLGTLEPVLDVLAGEGRGFHIDPILEPIGFGFAASLERYYSARRRWPDIPMMMGVGNLTELSEVDSAGVNFVLAGICQELGIHSVLATEVINWCRSAVSEFDLARRLVRHSVVNRVLPKHVDSRLVMLRDPKLRELGEASLEQLAAQLTDPNFRIFAERGELHVMNRDGYWRGTDAYEVFDRILAESGPVDATHAFYLGYELSKARTALTLGKQYIQDEALRWGFLTLPEPSAHDRRKKK